MLEISPCAKRRLAHFAIHFGYCTIFALSDTDSVMFTDCADQSNSLLHIRYICSIRINDVSMVTVSSSRSVLQESFDLRRVVYLTRPFLYSKVHIGLGSDEGEPTSRESCEV